MEQGESVEEAGERKSYVRLSKLSENLPCFFKMSYHLLGFDIEQMCLKSVRGV